MSESTRLPRAAGRRSSDTSTEGNAMRRGLLVVSALTLTFLAAFLGPVEAASVVVQDPVGNRVFDPLFASISGPGFEAVADLIAGDFGAAVDAPGSNRAGLNAQAGIFDPLRFTNTSSGPVPFPIMASFTGDYDLVFLDLTGAVATQLTGVLSTRIGGVSRFARAVHELRIDAAGATNNLTDSSSEGTVTVAQADFSGLDMTLAVPGITLNVGETIEVSISISATDQVNAPVTGTGRALADFCCSAQLSLVLPAGVELTNDTGQTLAWVTNEPAAVPEPATVWLVVAGLGSMMLGYGCRGRKRAGRDVPRTRRS